MQKNTLWSESLLKTCQSVCALIAVCTAFAVSGCATAIKPEQDGAPAKLGFQNPGLSPGNGGQLITEQSLQPGDIVLMRPFDAAQGRPRGDSARPASRYVIQTILKY